MKHLLLKIAIKVLYWLIFSKGTQLKPEHLIAAGWKQDLKGFFVEPFIKDRDKVWIQFEHSYYRVYHSENKTFIALETNIEWLQVYLFALDKHLQCSTRATLIK